MKRKHLLVTMLALIVLPAGLAMAEPRGPREGCRGDKPCGPKDFRGPRGPKGPKGPGEPGPAMMLKMFDWVTDMLPKQLELTEEQIGKFETIVKKNRAELEEIVKKLEAQRQKFDIDLKTILTPEQKEKLEQLQEKREKMMRRHRMGEDRERDRGRPGMFLQAIKKLDLPPEKAAKVKEIVKEAKAKVKEGDKGDRKGRGEIMRNMMDQLRDILSEEDMDRLHDIMREQMGRRDKGKGMHRGMRGGPGQGKRGMPADD